MIVTTPFALETETFLPFRMGACGGSFGSSLGSTGNCLNDSSENPLSHLLGWPAVQSSFENWPGKLAKVVGLAAQLFARFLANREIVVVHLCDQLLDGFLVDLDRPELFLEVSRRLLRLCG